MSRLLTIVALSDTHGLHDRITVPPGDILVHAGDLTRRGKLKELRDAARFLRALPHRHKIVIAGNHDFCFERENERDIAREWMATAATYLEDSSVEVEGLRFYGSPWQPWFGGWAFNLDRGPQLREKWDLIPMQTDVLVTHGPPHGHLDRTWDGRIVGCEELRIAVERVRPRLHVFGHIHEAYGEDNDAHTRYINPCVCTRAYQPTQAARVIELTVGD
ncbi:MAG: metallophosphatase domain-containing protein [Planctomycetota bacterium]